MAWIWSDPGRRRMIAAFGAGALCALVLPKVLFCILGTSLLLVSCSRAEDFLTSKT